MKRLHKNIISSIVAVLTCGAMAATICCAFNFDALVMESLILTATVVYLIMSVGNKLTIKQTMPKTSNVVMFALIVIIATALLSYGTATVTEKYIIENTSEENVQLVEESNEEE